MTGCNSSDCPLYENCERSHPNTFGGNYTYFYIEGKECSSFIPLKVEVEAPSAWSKRHDLEEF